jgi:hypothetical protein
MKYILVIWLTYSVGHAPPVVVATYPGIVPCEAAGKVWEDIQPIVNVHHVCLPAP